MSKNKIKIAVSSCLLGEAVRYDGTDKHIDYITTELAAKYNLISICPEMAVGMGVPRPPIHLVAKQGEIQVLGIHDASVNMTKPLLNYGHEVVLRYSDLCGYIFKKRSPSCGTKNVKVMNMQGEYKEIGQGIYAHAIMTLLPHLPLIDEEDLLNIKDRDSFLLNVEKYAMSLYESH